MARPVVGGVAEEIYSRLTPYAAQDEEYDWPLLRFCAAISTSLQWVEMISTDTPAGPGWSSIVDLDRVPDEGLPWIAQLAGVELDPDLSPAAQRLRIKETAGFKRGSREALIGAAKQYINGLNKTVVINERDTSPYHLRVTTFVTQTPDPDKVQAALEAQKPAGLILEYVSSIGATYGQLKATGKAYNELDGDYHTYGFMKVAILP